jgi:hypothetical protein
LSRMTRGPRPRSSPSDFRVWRSPRLRLTPRHIEFCRDLRWSHATAVAHFPTQSICSTGLHLVRWNGSQIELHRLHSEWLHSEQSCFCQKNGKLAALPAPAPCKLDPSIRVLPSLRSTLTEKALLDYTPRPRTRVSPLFALRTANPRRCSRSSLTSLDPLDRVVATLLDEFYLPFGPLHPWTRLLLGSRKPGLPFSRDTKIQ